jgi:acyl-CoA thioesterase I
MWMSAALIALAAVLAASPLASQCLTDKNSAPDWGRIDHYRERNLALSHSDARRVVFMGDSITYGWASQPWFRSQEHYVGRGISGQTAQQMLVRFRADVIDLKPIAVHIMAGTNDLAENTGPETDAEIEGAIASMVDLAQANGIAVVLAAVPPTTDFPWRRGLKPAPRIARINAWLNDYAVRRGAVFVNYAEVLAMPDGAMKPEFTADGVHFSEAGYAAIQPLAAAAIARALAAKR